MKNDQIKYRLNIIFGLVTGIISALQSFWFIPYVKGYLGTTAYGYISVINGLVNTLLVLSNAIGSMGTRFILVSLETNKKSEANKYFCSELVAILISSCTITLIGIFGSFNLNKFLNVTPNFYNGIQILLLMTIFSFCIQLVESPFSASFYYKNTLFITYLIFIVDYLSRILLTIILYHSGVLVIWSASLATDIVSIIGLLIYIYYSHKAIPSLVISKAYVSFKHLVELIKSGVWIAISSAGNMMLSSLNTYLSNLLCGVFITGIYASIMQLNIVESMVLSILVNTLLPKMYKIYSKSDHMSLYNYSITSMTTIALLLGIISGGIIVYGNSFMNLWMGKKFTGYVLLIILTVIHLPFTLPSQVLNQSFTVMNKVRYPALITIETGVLNIILAVIFVRLANVGVYGIAVANIISQVVRDCLLYPRYFVKANNVYNIKLFSPFIAALLSIGSSVVICSCIKYFIAPINIMGFVTSVMIGGVLSLLFLAPAFIHMADCKI